MVWHTTNSSNWASFSNLPMDFEKWYTCPHLWTCPRFQGCPGDPRQALVDSECPAGRLGKDPGRTGPKHSLPLRTPGMNSRTANMNQESRSSEDQLIQSKPEFPPNHNYLCGVSNARCHWRTVTLCCTAPKASQFADAENGTENTDTPSGICKLWFFFSVLLKVISLQVNNTTFFF